VIRYAEQAIRHIHVDDSLFARLKKTLGDRELVELAMTVGIANFTNRVTETLRMELP
jgi:alkylhydroperoxidase family enzyme